jgi:t-SNARE complex subunit (syntaxin)
MFQSLNDIVVQQGQTLNRLEDNICDAKGNTKDTVSELKEALKNESPSLGERLANPGRTNDLSTTCVLIWFIFALLMFLIDFRGE